MPLNGRRTMNESLRISNPDHDPYAERVDQMVGRLAVSGAGTLGEVRGRAFRAYGKWAWTGVTLDGSPWESTCPRVLHGDEESRLRTLMRDRVDRSRAA